MTDIDPISRAARHAAHHQDWAKVAQLATEILRLAPNDPEGQFLFGLVHNASRQPKKAIEAFEQALALGRRLKKISPLDEHAAAAYPAIQLNYHWPSAKK